MADNVADDRWSVRGVPKQVREAVAAAAERAGVSTGIWVCSAIDRALMAEREPMRITPPGRSVDIPSDMMSDADPLAVIELVVNAAVTLAGAADIPVGLRRRANRLSGLEHHSRRLP